MTPARDGVRWLLVVVLLCTGLAGFSSSQIQPDQDYTIRTTSRLVLLDVSVKDRSGQFVSGLKKDNFKIYEDGRAQTITQFGSADTPVTVGIVVDESGSMLPKRGEVIAAALQFIEASNPKDEIFVVNFNDTARLGLPDKVPFSDDVQQLRAALWRGYPEGRTALYDAIELAIHKLEQGRRDRKAMVVISDGGDNVSRIRFPEAMHDVLASLATIYTVGIFDEDDPERNPSVLKRLSQVSGGAAYFPSTLQEVVPVCRQIAKDIRQRYTIGYVPAAEGKAERHVKVDALSDSHKLLVRTRSSYYFAPEHEATNRK
jgi:VWFA-related protein